MNSSLRKAPDRRWLRGILAAVLFLVAGALLVWFFNRIPTYGTSLATDWGGLWNFTKGGLPKYGTGLHHPPWSLLPVLPLGLLSMRTGWAIVTLLTLAVLVISVPPHPTRQFLGIVLLITSYPSLRTIADGNFEFLVTSGVLLLLYAFRVRNPWLLAGGVLLATAKFQEVWLLLFALAYAVLRTWPPRMWLKSVLLAAAVVVPCILWLDGRTWLVSTLAIEERGSMMDSSLLAASTHLGLPGWLLVVLWGGLLVATILIIRRAPLSLSREKAGMLVAASLLLAPYAAGDSLLTVLAIGVIPLFLWKPWVGFALILLVDLQYLAAAVPGLLFAWSATYATGWLILTWSVLCWFTLRQSQLQSRESPLPLAA